MPGMTDLDHTARQGAGSSVVSPSLQLLHVSREVLPSSRGKNRVPRHDCFIDSWCIGHMGHPQAHLHQEDETTPNRFTASLAHLSQKA